MRASQRRAHSSSQISWPEEVEPAGGKSKRSRSKSGRSDEDGEERELDEPPLHGCSGRSSGGKAAAILAPAYREARVRLGLPSRSSRWKVNRCMVNAWVGQRVAHIEQRMQAVSSLSITPPRASSSRGSKALSCCGVDPELGLGEGQQARVLGDLREADEVQAVVGAHVDAAVAGDALLALEVGLHVAAQAALGLASRLGLGVVLLDQAVGGGGQLGRGAGPWTAAARRSRTSQSWPIVYCAGDQEERSTTLVVVRRR